MEMNEKIEALESVTSELRQRDREFANSLIASYKK